MYSNIMSKAVYKHYHYAVPVIDPWLGTWVDLVKLGTTKSVIALRANFLVLFPCLVACIAWGVAS